ncbi:hypothetical protein GMOD_00003384 [Pyrenophora seminiperda CCB06]|uniref:DUF262 domain-containing protein n=1 Tax=Pyrenophora seminiperda CCB06 TaxID=1302712 RepID=A0A3M7MJ23_9PLEO|nr:hypothetical protein GMOD_00003384 [Pyrenophora seminiperda CCB06]
MDDGTSHNNDSATQTIVKDEVDDESDGFEDVEDDDPTEFKPRPQLPSAIVNMRSLKSLIRELENGVINVDPEYQREVVWTENYYVPPIILNRPPNTANNNSTSDTLVCVDGKQRLSSRRKMVALTDLSWDLLADRCRWFCDHLGSTRRRLLPPKTQQLFLEKEFVVFQFKDLSSEQEEDLFGRVQMGMQLTAAEKMRAKSGQWQELAKLFVEDFDAIYSLLKDRQRAKDFQLTLGCFSQIMEVKHPSTENGIPTFKAAISSVNILLKQTAAVDDATKSHLAGVWKTFQDLLDLEPNTFTNADKYLSGVQTFAPIEMVAVTVLISQHSKTRNNNLLLGDIRALREALREHFQELRAKLDVWKFVWEFIDDLEAIRGAVDGSTVSRNTLQQPVNPTAPDATATVSCQPVAAPSFQRKRPLPKSKQIPILPPVIKAEHETQPPTSSLPSRKRQRTDPVQAVFDPLKTSSVTKTDLTNEENSFQETISTATASWSHQVATNTLPQSIPQLTPLLVQSTKVGDFNTFRAPITPMQSSTGSLSALGNISTLHGGSSDATTPYGPPNTNQSHSKSTRTPVRPQGFSIFAPSHTDEEWNGIIASVSPKIPWKGLPQNSSVAPPAAESAAPSVAAGLWITVPKNRKRKSTTLPATKATPAELDHVIDLTSDGELENERQNLLQAFKSKPATIKQTKGPAPQITCNSKTGDDPDLEDERQPANNPYAKFKQSPRAGPGGFR